MSEKELLKLIRRGESEQLEFKKSLAEWREVIENISAFSNTRGGVILVGVTDDCKVFGVKVGKKSIEDLANKIKQNTDPKVYPSISINDVKQKRVIKIRIEESLSKPVFAFGVAFKKVGKTTQKASSEEVRRMALEMKKIYWDEQVCAAAIWDDIDKEKVRRYLERRESVRGIRSPKVISPKKLLVNIGAVEKIGKNKFKITNGGALFFTKDPQKFIVQSRVRVARFRGEEMRDFDDRQDLVGVLPEIIDQAEKFIERHIRLSGLRGGLGFRRLDKLEYPLGVVREAIINAVIHRNYSEPSEVRVGIFDNRIEIHNPGAFPEGVTPENPIHKPVNPVVCQFMYDMGYIEKWGSGIIMMKREMKRWGLAEPKFEGTKGAEVVVTLFSRAELIRKLNQRQREAIKYLEKEGIITRAKYVELCRCSERTALIDLSDLVKKKFLARRGRGRGTYYEIVL